MVPLGRATYADFDSIQNQNIFYSSERTILSPILRIFAVIVMSESYEEKIDLPYFLRDNYLLAARFLCV